MPYLRIFDEETGSREVELTAARTAIGRKPERCEIVLAKPSVSRIHATILRAHETYILEDQSSRGGTLLNAAPCFRETLRHGDVIQIGYFILEFRTDDLEYRKRLQSESDTAINRALRMNFRLCPAGLHLRYRTINIDPEEIFETGDTLAVADGGILVPDPNPPEVGACLELELLWPNRTSHHILGEVVSHLDVQGQTALCIKMHKIDKTRHQHILSYQNRGSWVKVQ